MDWWICFWSLGSWGEMMRGRMRMGLLGRLRKPGRRLVRDIVEMYKQLLEQQERVLQAYLYEREALSALDSYTGNPEFIRVASSLLALKKPDSALWRDLSSSYA